jgi:hypothetical protein
LCVASTRTPLLGSASLVTVDITFGDGKAHASPPGGSVALGAYVSGAPWKPTKIDRFSSMVGRPPSVVMWYQGWAHAGIKEFDPHKMDAVSSRGAMPMVTWKQWDHTGGANQRDYPFWASTPESTIPTYDSGLATLPHGASRSTYALPTR